MGMTATAAYWFLPAVIPLTIYISWSDMRSMKITNMSVYALVLAYAVLGPFAFGWGLYFSQWLHLPVMLAFCILLWMARVMGAGDAKLIAAMSPFFLLADLELILRLFAATLIGALITHSLVRFTPLRRLAPDWESWKARGKNLRGGIFGWDLAFPKGLALSTTLLFYLLWAAILR